jgi:DNA-directed RNA polymerase subunit M/transcription elongation factor TFIIS
METANEIFKRENTELKIKVSELEAKVSELEKKIYALGGKTNKCRFCGQKRGEFLYVGQSKEFSSMDIQVRFFKCGNCGNEYEKQYMPNY